MNEELYLKMNLAVQMLMIQLKNYFDFPFF